MLHIQLCNADRTIMTQCCCAFINMMLHVQDGLAQLQ